MKNLDDSMKERVQHRENIKEFMNEQENKDLINNLFNLPTLAERKELRDTEQCRKLIGQIRRQKSKEAFI